MGGGGGGVSAELDLDRLIDGADLAGSLAADGRAARAGGDGARRSDEGGGPPAVGPPALPGGITLSTPAANVRLL